MIKNIFKCVAIAAIIFLISCGQQEEAQRQEFEYKMIQNYNDLINADSKTRYDSIAPKFKEELRTLLLKQETLKYPFDSLDKYINIVSSADKKLRLFSWDEMTGGTMHQMAVLAQYKDDMDNVYCEFLDSDFYGDEIVITDIIFYKINDVIVQDIPHYIAFGWGTFGGGSHFKIVKAFRIDKYEISNDNKIFKTYDELYSEIYLSTSRGTKINLSYDYENQIIEFDEFRKPSEYEEMEMGYMHRIPTGNKIKLKFNGEIFESE